MSRFELIAAECASHDVTRMTQLRGVSTSGYDIERAIEGEHGQPADLTQAAATRPYPRYHRPPRPTQCATSCGPIRHRTGSRS